MDYGYMLMEETIKKNTVHQCDNCALYVRLYVNVFGSYLIIKNAGGCLCEMPNCDTAYKFVQYYDTCDKWISADKFIQKKKKVNHKKIALKRIAKELATIADNLKE